MLAYLGATVPLKKLLCDPPNSLVNQAKAPRHHPLLQLAGWGFALWSKDHVDPLKPLLYKRACAAFFDDNLNTLVPSLCGELVLAHVRAANYRAEGLIADENCHPFNFEGAPWILAHNGFILDWRGMQAELFSKCDERWMVQRKGTTDTELVYALFLSLLQESSDPFDFDNLCQACRDLLDLLQSTSRKLKHKKPMKLKLILAAPDRLFAINYGADENGDVHLTGDLDVLRGFPIGSPEFLKSTILEPLYFQLGRDYDRCARHFELDSCKNKAINAVLIASEPLTDDESLWEQLHFGQALLVERKASGHCSFQRRNVFS